MIGGLLSSLGPHSPIGTMQKRGSSELVPWFSYLCVCCSEISLENRILQANPKYEIDEIQALEAHIGELCELGHYICAQGAPEVSLGIPRVLRMWFDATWLLDFSGHFGPKHSMIPQIEL